MTDSVPVGFTGRMQRRVTIIILKVNISSRLEEETTDIRMTIGGSDIQGGPSVKFIVIDIGIFRD